MAGTLHIVATPIGNLDDITARAIKILGAADLILCEDTRVAQKMLARFGIQKPRESYHQHSTLRKADYILDLLREGKNLALVSDAGTPGICDPGNQLVSAAVEKFGDEIKIIPVPGASAVAAALSVCGFCADKFVFFGISAGEKQTQKVF